MAISKLILTGRKPRFFMKKSTILFILLSCNSTPTVAELQLTLSPSLLYFDYTEFSTSDQILNREHGGLPGVTTKLSYSINPDWLISVYSSYYKGTVKYTGQTQKGIPHITTTRTGLFRLGGRVEKNIFKNIHLFIGTQIHEWERDIQDNNVIGIYEIYKWFEHSIGISTEIFFSKEALLNIEASYLATTNGTIDVDLSRVDFGSARLDLGNDSGLNLNLSWKRARENGFYYGLSLFFESRNFGRTNTKKTQGGSRMVFVTEPRSEMRNRGATLNTGYYF